MNRKYNSEQFKNLISKIYKLNPNTAITTDVIAAFPTETDLDHKNTIEFIKEIGFSKLHIFPYSRRSYTPAAKLQQINQTIVDQRIKDLFQLNIELGNIFNKRFINKIVDVLFETYDGEINSGYSSEYIRVDVNSKINYSNQIKKNHDYEETKKVICLNIMMGNFQKVNEEIVNSYIIKNRITNKIINTGEMEIVLIRLDKVSKIVYTENRFIKWLKFINAKDFLELEKIGKDDEIMEHSIEYLKSYCGSSEDHNFEDYVAEKEYLAKKEGILDTAKKLLKMGLPLEKISEGTGLSQKEVESLKKEL